MTSYTKLIIGIVLIITMSVTYLPFAEARGLGVAPNYIRMDDALRGAIYQQTIHIDNYDDYDSNILLYSNGSIAPWVTFYEMNNIEHPITTTFISNKSSKPVLVKIIIPEDAENKEYNGTLIVTATPIKPPTNQQNYSLVDLSLPIILSLNVTGDQILDISVVRVEAEDTEITYPLKFRVGFKNNGNVRVTPKIDIMITKDGMYIDRCSSHAYQILPEQLITHTMYWNTTGKISGAYNAYFNITNDGIVIAQQNISFDLFPPGTFTRNGTLNAISYNGSLEEGRIVKIIATFRNTGEVYTTAKFIGEVYKQGVLVDTIESAEVIVQKFEEKEITAYLTIKENGEYSIKGYILYGGQTTNTKELPLTVGFVFPFGLNISIILLIVIIGIVIIFSGIMIMKKQIHKDKYQKINRASFKQSKKNKRVEPSIAKTPKDNEQPSINSSQKNAADIESEIDQMWLETYNKRKKSHLDSLGGDNK